MGKHVVTMVQLIMGKQHVFAILNDRRHIRPIGLPIRFAFS